MTMAPRLSIGLPVRNGENYLAESIDSLLGQSYQDFELIISDNASTDSTADICRRYEKQDPRIRYFRQPQNIGLAPNHNFAVEHARGELFKWAASDDVYGRDLLQRCVDALDEYPHVVLAHSWTAAIDGEGNVTQSLEYPLATDSPSAPERFRTILFGGSGVLASGGASVDRSVPADNNGVMYACDQYGVIRTDVLRRVAPLDSYHHADRIIVCELALHGPFHMTPEWLYFRRDHPDRAYRAYSTVRTRCASLDPRRTNRLRHPTARLLAEYLWGYAAAIRRAPLSSADRQQCYRHLAQWMLGRAASRVTPERPGRIKPPTRPVLNHDAVSVNATVPGWENKSS
jgi:glycosyltransferase involved in cell wall biosynthesis